MDTVVRQRALNTHESFIVQAPAGSGKTELLTQRLLALLATINAPEEIVALTFTRKAAQEMAHRVLAALKDAANNTPVISQHQAHTRKLAQEALNHAKHQGFDLINNPNQLRITTFDAFALSIYQSIPQEQSQKIAGILSNPMECYHQAVTTFYDICRNDPNYQQHLEQLIRSVNNKLEYLFSGLVKLLASRDTWLHVIQENKHLDQKSHETKLRDILNYHWQVWPTTLDSSLKQELLNMVQRLLAVLGQTEHPLNSWVNFDEITAEQLASLKQLITTQMDEVRKEWNHHVGLKNDLAPASIIKPLKEDSKSLLLALSEQHDFLQNLIHLCQIPHPQAFDLDWVSLQSFYQLLPILVACLHLEFSAQGKADFSFFAQQALFALEESDIALYFDNQLQHLLIDEFQDTSWTQLAFIRELTRNWTSEPQKTLFLVGDPMQSIYRFRHADVSIFLSIQNHGLPGIAITPLYLSQNFRSSAQLIHQFNQYFKPIFPQQDEICFGGVKFHEAIPALAADENAGTEAYYFDNLEQQIYFIIQQLQSAKTIKTAAILVRSRSQLPIMLHLFDQAELKYQGMDLFPLAELLHIRDVWQLTQILLNPGERQHELAAFHSPFCGLDLADLNCLAETLSKRSFIQQLLISGIPENLSEEGKIRLHYFIAAIEEAQNLYHQMPLVDVVFRLCQRLQIHAILNSKELLDYERFLDILEQASQDTPWPSIATIQSILEASFVSSHADFGLQVMTIHKSKGLEFDWVFMPNMGDSSLQSNPSLFYTFTANYPKLEQHRICLPHLSNNKLQYIYEWHDALQEQYEQLRLCYVAFTRAKKRLFLLDKSEKYHKNSFRHLFGKNFFQAKSVTLEIKPHLKTMRSFKRLPLSTLAKNEPTLPVKGDINSLAFSDSQEQKQIGILLHLILQWICEYHPNLETDIPWQLLKPYMHQFAWSHEQKSQALAYIQTLIHEFWQHPIGQWIKSSYAFEKNEYELLVRDGHIVRTIILDRCFIDNGTLWIIDFKTANQHQSYRVQLNRYAKAMQVLYPDNPIYCGIFYLGKQYFESWAYDKELEFELET